MYVDSKMLSKCVVKRNISLHFTQLYHHTSARVGWLGRSILYSPNHIYANTGSLSRTHPHAFSHTHTYGIFYFSQHKEITKLKYPCNYFAQFLDTTSTLLYWVANVDQLENYHRFLPALFDSVSVSFSLYFSSSFFSLYLSMPLSFRVSLSVSLPLSSFENHLLT